METILDGEPLKNNASFGTTSTTIFTLSIEEHTQRINTSSCVKIKKQTYENRSSEDQRIVPRLKETKRMRPKLLTTQFIVKLRAGIEHYTQKFEPFSIFLHLCEQINCFIVFLVHSLCNSLAAQYTHLASARATEPYTR